MERLDLWIKAAVAFVSTFVSYLVEGFGLAVTVLFGLMLIDYATGFMVGVVQKNLKSAIGIKGLFKKVYVLLLISSFYLLELVVPFEADHIANGIAIVFCINELLSITENGGKLGAPMPAVVKNTITVLRGRVDKP